jgi:hypothetical protein
MLVGGVVIDDEMDVELGWHVGLDVTQEGEELLMAMARLALGDDRAVKHVEGGEQRGGAVALIVVGNAFDVAEPHGKHGLGAFEGLDLAHMGICGSRCSDQDSMVNLRSLLRIQGLSPFA